MLSSNILGHEKPLKIINAYIEKFQFCGAYIFSGPEGVGKKMIAKFIAQKLNCSPTDLHVIENGQAQIKIEDIRTLIREANFRPYEGAVKVFIIDNAHKLNIEAANSLLKILEEPPCDALIILITHKPQSLIKTILSRCKVIKFASLERAVLEDFLIKNYSLDKLSAHFLGFYAEGRLGLALSLKDSLSLNEKNRIFDSFMQTSKPLDRNVMGQSKEQLHSYLNILASWFRDIYLLKAGLRDKDIIHLDRQDDLLSLAPKYSFKQLDDIMAVISESLLYLERNINSKLLLHNLWLWLKEAKPLPCGLGA